MIHLRKPVAMSTALFALNVIAFTIGCGSSSTQVRLLNAMDGQTSINMLVDNNTLATGVAFGAASSYASVGSGSHTLQIQANSATLFNQTVSISSGNNTVLATNSGPTVFADNKTTPSSGNIQIRVINASTSLGTTDVYVVASGADISTVNPTFAGLAFQSASGYATLAAANAAEALEVIDANAQIDLLFTDVIMPGAMNGRQLVDEAQRRRPGLKTCSRPAIPRTPSFITGGSIPACCCSPSRTGSPTWRA